MRVMMHLSLKLSKLIKLIKLTPEVNEKCNFEHWKLEE